MRTTESSNHKGKYPASKLIDGLGIDGILNSGGCAHTDGGSSEWFSLELDMPRKVTRVQIANRVDVACCERGQNVRISIGPSEVYDPNEPLCLPEIPELHHQPGLKDYKCTKDVLEGKFVKISRAGAGYLHLCEVKVFTNTGN